MTPGLLRMDLHIHSCYSEDGNGTPKEIVKSVRKKGLNGIAITDHNTVKGSLKALRFRSDDFIIIPGEEVSTLNGHLLVYGIKDDLPKGKSIEETVEIAIDEGGVPVVPHVYRLFSGIKKRNLLKIRKHVGAMEVFNSCSWKRVNKKMSKLAKRFGFGGTGGSDAHSPEYAGYAYTLINTTDFSLDSILTEIEKGRTWGLGQCLPLKVRKDRAVLAVKQFFQRGFKKI